MSGQTMFENPLVHTSLPKDPRPVHPPRLQDAWKDLFTLDEIQNLAKHVTSSSSAELVNFHLRPFSEEKLGFLASHLRLVLEVGTEKHSLFVKTVPFDVPTQAAYIEEKGCFRKEADFLRFLVPIMTEGWDIEPWTPRCYLAKDKTLVFEDMNSRGFANRSRFFDLPTMKSAVACVARFHASSLLAEEKLGKSFFELYPDMLQESEFLRTGQSYAWYRTAMDLAVYLADSLGLDSSKILKSSEAVFDMAVPSRTKRNVVSHGDIWSSNMLFDASGRCNLIDFQLIRYAPLAHDLVQLLYLTCTREFRRKHEKDIIRFYYDTLVDILKVNGLSSVPSFQELLQGVEEQRYPAVVTAMIFHPTVLMDGKTAARIMDDPKTYAVWYFQDRKPFVREIMAQDKEYERQLMENARELAEMSLIVDTLPRPT